MLGEQGMGDSWGGLHVPYLLAKYVFPRLAYPGWVGLHAAALREKTMPYTMELRTNWERLKQSHVRMWARVRGVHDAQRHVSRAAEPKGACEA